MLDAVTATLDPPAPSPAARSLADRDEYGRSPAAPAASSPPRAPPHPLGERDEFGCRLADWVPARALAPLAPRSPVRGGRRSGPTRSGQRRASRPRRRGGPPTGVGPPTTPSPAKHAPLR